MRESDLCVTARRRGLLPNRQTKGGRPFSQELSDKASNPQNSCGVWDDAIKPVGLDGGLWRIADTAIRACYQVRSHPHDLMSRFLRWGIGLLLIAGLLLGAFLFLPFRSWLPGGTVADVPNREVVNGTRFNKLFPTPATGEQLVFTQEKRGFSQARLKRAGEVRALLSISDLATAPASRTKFSHSDQTLSNWPLVDQGTQASALLVADRFQVKVIGQGTGLDQEQRHSLLGAFDLPGLAALNPAVEAGGKVREALPAGKEAPLKLPLPGQRTPAGQPLQRGAAEPTAAVQPTALLLIRAAALESVA